MQKSTTESASWQKPLYGIKNNQNQPEIPLKSGVLGRPGGYWQIFTQEDFPKTCPFCGLPMTEDEVDGCHIKIKGLLQGSWTVKKYIIPGHHGCNMKQDEEFDAQITVKAVEAIEK